jgi:hypothetical protein
MGKGEFEPGRNNQAAIRDDLGSAVRDIHYLAFGGRDAMQRDPGRLVPNPANFSLLLFWLHCTRTRAVNPTSPECGAPVNKI